MWNLCCFDLLSWIESNKVVKIRVVIRDHIFSLNSCYSPISPKSPPQILIFPLSHINFRISFKNIYWSVNSNPQIIFIISSTIPRRRANTPTSSPTSPKGRRPPTFVDLDAPPISSSWHLAPLSSLPLTPRVELISDEISSPRRQDLHLQHLVPPSTSNRGSTTRHLSFVSNIIITVLLSSSTLPTSAFITNLRQFLPQPLPPSSSLQAQLVEEEKRRVIQFSWSTTRTRDVLGLTQVV